MQQSCLLYSTRKRRGFVSRVPKRHLHGMDRNGGSARLLGLRRSPPAGAEVATGARPWGTHQHTNPLPGCLYHLSAGLRSYPIQAASHRWYDRFVEALEQNRAGQEAEHWKEVLRMEHWDYVLDGRDEFGGEGKGVTVQRLVGPEELGRAGLDSTAIGLSEAGEERQPGSGVLPWAEALRDNWGRWQTVAGTARSHGQLYSSEVDPGLADRTHCKT